MDEQSDLAGPGVRWCAVLRARDIASLADLGASAAEAAAIGARGWLSPPGGPDAPALIAPVRQAVLGLMRRTQPHIEAELHERAIGHFMDLLARAATPGDWEKARDACIYHLGALHDLFIESMEWAAIIPYTTRLRNLDPTSGRSARWAEYFAAYADVRGEAASQGLARIERLLADEAVEPALRLRALHTGHIAWTIISRYDRALEALRAAHALAHRLGDRVRRSYVLLSMGQIYNDLYDNRRALRLSLLSLRLARAEGATYREAHALYEVGNNAMQLGRWSAASEALAAADTMFRQLGMTRRLAMIRWAQGMTALVQGEYARCAALLREGLAISQAENTHNALTAMDILAQLGLLGQAQGDHQAALAQFRAAIAITDSHEIHHWRPIWRARVAGILAGQGRDAEALHEWRTAAEEVEAMRDRVAAEDIRVTLFGTTPYIYESLVLFLLDRGDVAQAFAYVERARSRAFLDLLASQGGDSAAEAAGRPADVATITDLQRSLGPDEVVLEYFTTGARPNDDHWINAIPRENRALLRAVLPAPTTVVFVITADSAVVHRLRDAAYRPQASAAERAAAPDLDPNKLRPSAHSEDPVLDMLRIDLQIAWLSQRLLAPLEGYIAGRSRVAIIPHGTLHYVPFVALRRQSGRYLLDAGGPAVIFAPSASVLIHTRRAQPPAPGQPSLAIGYNGPPERRLDYAEYEAAVVADLIGADTWAGPEAKSERLIGRQRRLRWLHIAGHTIFEGGRARLAGLHLGQGDILSAAQIMGAASQICKADMVTLSACMSGYSQVLAGDELFGLQRAFLAAVAPTIICTVARARDRVSLLVMEQLYTRLLADAALGPAEALRDALVAVRSMTRAEVSAALTRHGYEPLLDGGQPAERPFDQPEFWAPFIVIGSPYRSMEPSYIANPHIRT
jgi:CHAT domain-containing protein/tetratricopeptide (TPR) repeat protein